ncbi:MAG TPA: hypothetical protein VLC46_23015 [Thermoanaerobaculia bacterium]|jgi:predicted amidohydrolase|nr:hypothetical protein [Thermoanaerobaculia bacterium]
MPDRWIEEEVDSLRASLDDTPKINPFSWMVETICGVTMVDGADGSSRKNRPPRLRVALVSMPKFPFELCKLSSLTVGTASPAGIDPRACARTLVSFKGAAPGQMLRAFNEALDAAIETFRANVICVSELGLPSEDMVPMPEAKQLAWQKSQDHKVLIVAGSAHDSRTLYNTGYLFRPGGPKDGHGFHKTVSARSVEELISSPASRRVVALNFAGFQIAVMICLDIADYASIASVVKVADGVDILLVPCYTPKFEEMVSIAKVTSKALPGIVALVNADLPECTAKPCQIAHFGKLAAASKTKKLKSGAIISLLDIDCAEFEKTRNEMKSSEDPKIKRMMREMETLFGRRDMPSVRTP